ncbi:putative UDP-galactose transporter [Aspergillus candidus]|uniref:Putative UDP-galactose transporter n=1 Tax=Aspergillus candidus TaxID=41067 RepID=A0A2I2F2G8_ASPCN|nr:putative UDP-galactose transporter [Aspergillus candidus]PLB34817.1 putative UDP-galactose transporter [Aspergillus candidus]
MGDTAPRQSSGPGTTWNQFSWVLLTVQYTTFALLLHYSRVMPPTGGKRYLTSTAVFFNEVVKLGISLTMALYEVSRSAPPTVPATSLLSSLASAVFSGDSWKLVIPACLYTLANSLQYIALSNLQAATFQATYQLKMIVSAIFGLLLLKRSVSPRKWGLLLLLLVGVCLVQMPDGSSDVASLGDEAAQHAFPRSFEEWKAAKSHHGGLHKRSATYEGIEEDLQTANPRMNGAIGLLATVGASVASGLAGIYFEKVLKDSAKMTSLWIRNVQLAVYSVFPALFIGVIFLDGEKISSNGVFAGYNWTVWSSIVVQAVVGLTTSFCIRYAHRDMRNVATATSIIFTTLGSSLFFDMELSSTFLVGTFGVLVATYLCEDTGPVHGPGKRQSVSRPPPLEIDRYEKDAKSNTTSPASPEPKEFSIKLPTTPFLTDSGVSTSRPTSPGYAGVSTSRTVSSGSYFDKH